MNDYLLEQLKKVCNANPPEGCAHSFKIINDLNYLIEYLSGKYNKIDVRQKVSDRIKEIGYSTDLGFDKWFPDRIHFYNNQWKKMIDYPDLVYKALNEIGLENYLKDRGNGTIYQEAHMEEIDSFVNNLSAEQKKILKDKTNKKKNETHMQHNDMLHEISIACAFYDNVKFLPETYKKTPDFCSNGVYVEIKTINNSDIERKRLDELNKGPNCEISPALNQSEVERIKKEFIDCVGKKFKDQIETAKKQLNLRGGHIWIVYAIDSPPKLHEKINKEIENKFDEIIKKIQSENFCIRYICFESLREKIAS